MRITTTPRLSPTAVEAERLLKTLLQRRTAQDPAARSTSAFALKPWVYPPHYRIRLRAHDLR